MALEIKEYVGHEPVKVKESNIEEEKKPKKVTKKTAKKKKE